MKGYKAFNRDWTCKGFQYEVGKSFTHEGALLLCRSGFHFCTSIEHCFDFYSFDPNWVRIAEVEAVGEIIRGHDVCVTNKIKIKREIKWDEVCTLINDGFENVGIANHGNNNTGSRNYGNGNSGCSNEGDANKGNSNHGWNNFGTDNFGTDNFGTDNIGRLNIGSCNIGLFNHGFLNIGMFNIGSYNIGMFNIGFPKNKSLIPKLRKIWSTVSTNFNTKNWSNSYDEILSSDYIKDDIPLYMFNKKSTWTMGMWNNSKARLVLCEIFCVNGQAAPQNVWNMLSKDDKNEILSLPNFNAKIFEQITEIKVK